MERNFNLEQLLPLNRVAYGYGHLTKINRFDNLPLVPIKCVGAWFKTIIDEF